MTPLHLLRDGSVGIVTRVALGIAGLGLVIDTLWTLSTLVLPRPVLPTWPIFVLFVLVFPLQFRTVFLGRKNLDFLNGIPRTRAGWAVSALFVGYWLLGMSALLRLRNGGPEKDGGQYYTDNHGSRTQISKGAYHQLQLAEERLFTAIPAAFMLIAVAANIALALRSVDRGGPGGDPHAVTR